MLQFFAYQSNRIIKEFTVYKLKKTYTVGCLYHTKKTDGTWFDKFVHGAYEAKAVL